MSNIFRRIISSIRRSICDSPPNYDDVDLYDDIPDRAHHVESIVSSHTSIETPAFVIDDLAIIGSCRSFRGICDSVGAIPLYSIKSLDHSHVIELISRQLDGFSASSLGEVMAIENNRSGHGSIHITTPGFKECELSDLLRKCDYISLNSSEQLSRFREVLKGSCNTEIGIRVNPEVSLVNDPRIDPCKTQSKLGVPLSDLKRWQQQDIEMITGVHLHSSCDNSEFEGLLRTTRKLVRHIPRILDGVSWVNLGGGYIFSDQADGKLREAVSLLTGNRDIKVFLEPGASLVRRAGYLVTTVLDIFIRDGVHIAVLDTTVNHVPEAYEYQYGPDVLNDCIDAEYEYRLVGCTCLAGDDFGMYGFSQPICVGARLILYDVGAYTMVKWHSFNGVNIPNIYRLDADDNLENLH